jgi:hypothetical protein
MTGGLQDQCGVRNDAGELLDPETDFTADWGSNHDGRFQSHGEWAFTVFPVSRSLQGSPMTPYIYDDRCDWSDAARQLWVLYHLGRTERKRCGELGRQFIIGPSRMNADAMSESFVTEIERGLDLWVPRSRFDLVRV